MLSLLLLLLLLLVVVVDRGGRGCRQMAKESHHVRYTNTRTLLAEKTTELANWQKEWRQQTIRMVSPLQTCRSHRDSICRCRPTKKLTRSQSPTELHTHTHTHTHTPGRNWRGWQSKRVISRGLIPHAVPPFRAIPPKLPASASNEESFPPEEESFFIGVCVCVVVTSAALFGLPGIERFVFY